MSPAEILSAPIVCDIIVSDFGRDAAIEYVRLVSQSERRLLRNILDETSAPFFDEYRRLMFTLVADLSFFKAPFIAEARSRPGYIDDRVLIGFGHSRLVEETYRRITQAVLEELEAAAARGHRRARVIVPCNRLSDYGPYFLRTVGATKYADGLYAIRHHAGLSEMRISAHSVVDIVAGFLANTTTRDDAPVLLLAAPETHDLYTRAFRSRRLPQIEITPRAQELVNDLIFASIAADAASLRALVDELDQDVVAPLYSKFPDLRVIEACTDFQLGVGSSTLTILADAMVNAWYAYALGPAIA